MDFEALLKLIKKMQETGGAFRYLVDGLPGLTGRKIDLGHKVIVGSVPRTGELILYVEILGVLKIGGVLAKEPPGADKIEHIYAYDLSQKVDRSKEFSIDAAVFDAEDWRKVGLGLEDPAALKAYFAKELNALAHIYYRQRLAASASTEAPSAPEAASIPSDAAKTAPTP
jgi:hypothetical protein